MKSSTESLISALRVLALDVITNDGVVNVCLEEAAGRLEELDRANKNTLADLALAIERRDEARAEMHRLEKLTRAAAFARDDAFNEVQRVRKLWNESHIAQRDDFAKEEARLKAELTEAIKERKRLEPSRLEIAAMVLAALAGRESKSWEAKLSAIWAIEQADELIALAKINK